MNYAVTGWRSAFAAFVITVLSGAPAFAQAVYTGRIDIEVQDATGGVLPGVTVTISGPLAQSAVSDEGGQARFLNLPPGVYTVRASLQGFTEYVHERLQVDTGSVLPLRVNLRVAGVSEQVAVTAETPVVEPKKQSVSTNVTYAELQNLPSSRDPWVVLQTVPGVIVDRVNVGGAESGQQSFYLAKGAATGENTWTMDGIPITDMSALGSSPTYFDFDMFQEMQVTTGGADVQSSTAGAQLNMILRQGANQVSGSTRVYFANESMQSNNLPAELSHLTGQTGKGNRTDQYSDYGFEIGGPFLRDKWWGWGSVGRTDARLLTINNVLDRTKLENYAFKSHAQLTNDVRTGFTYFKGNKIKNGRGASATRPTETTWDQDGPTDLFKGELNFVVSNNLFLVGRGAYVKNSFTLKPKGQPDLQTYRDAGGVFHNNFQDYATERPATTLMADGNYFRGRHEVKFGFSSRRFKVDSTLIWPGGAVNLHNSANYAATGQMLSILYRPYESHTDGNYLGAYVGDTISWDRLTVNLAIRWDRQSTSSLETVVASNPIAPELLAGFTAPALDNAITFNTPGPRLGFTYALNESRTTQVRGSYAMFASQLNASDGGFASAATYAYAYYLAFDANRNGTAEPNELSTFLGTVAVDPDDPASTTSVNRVSADLKSPKTHELVFGIDHELFRNFGLSASASYRRFNDFTWKPLIGVTSADYHVDGVVSGTFPGVGTVNQPFYALDAEALPAGGGREYSTREGYYQRYWGFEVQAVKRMSDRWMGRLAFSTNDHREYFTETVAAIEDPTPNPGNNGNTNFTGYAKRNGALVVTEGTGSGKADVYLVQPKYQFVANGAYQAPYGINLGVNLVTRQGYGMPFYALTDTNDPATPQKEVLVVNDVGDFRLPAVTSLDFRVGKEIAFGRTRLNVDFDVFNLTNQGTELRRQYDVTTTGNTGANQVLEIMNPRILRVGLRLNF
jgi:hypothetical protein